MPLDPRDLADYVQKKIDDGGKRGEALRMRAIGSQIAAGDQAAMTEGLGLDPDATKGYDEQHTVELKKLRGAAKYMKDALKTNNPQAIQGAWQAVRPTLEKQSGKPVPEAWSGDMIPAIEQTMASTEYLDSLGTLGAAQRGFEANIANMPPEDQARARAVRAGIVARAQAKGAGYSTDTDEHGNFVQVYTDPANHIYRKRSSQTGGWEDLADPTDAAPATGAPPDAAPPAAAAPAPVAPAGTDTGDMWPEDMAISKGNALLKVMLENGASKEAANDASEELVKSIIAKANANGFATRNAGSPVGGVIPDAPLPPAAAQSAPAAAPAPPPVAGTASFGQSKADEAASSAVATGTIVPMTAAQKKQWSLPPDAAVGINSLTGKPEVLSVAVQPKVVDPIKMAKYQAEVQVATQSKERLVNSYDRMLQKIKQLREDKGFASLGTLMGDAAALNPYSNAHGAKRMLTTLIDEGVIQTIQDMKAMSKTGATGFGSLSEREGQRLENSKEPLSGYQSHEYLVKALDGLEKILTEDRAGIANLDPGVNQDVYEGGGGATGGMSAEHRAVFDKYRKK